MLASEVRQMAYRDEIQARAGEVRFLVVPKHRYLAIEGTAAPGSDEFAAAIGTLYPVAYTLHFALKERGIEAPVGAMEGLFRADRSWRLQLPVPEPATEDDIGRAIETVRIKKAPAQLDRLRVETVDEGESAQILHVGPYEAEEPTIARLRAAIAEHGLRPRGSHHEIYLSDPRRTTPDRIRTVIRQPVEAGPGKK